MRRRGRSSTFALGATRLGCGFSLVELLVVIGILAILIGILLPTVTLVRESANTVKCAAQLRNIGQAIFNYTASNGGLLPAWAGNHSYPNDVLPDDRLGPGWIAELERYSGVKADSPLYQCPAFRSEQHVVTYFLAARYEGRQTPVSTSMPISRIALSSQFVLSGDVTNTYWYQPPFGEWNRDFDNVDKDDNLQPCILFFGETYPKPNSPGGGAIVGGGMNMHRAGNNILFADGHVRAFRRYDPQSITYHPSELHDWDWFEGMEHVP
jgi:prepilin-type N-terminal cleavage/methylation domain-containing protein/prepilin-type processing-associated H-X9-DG protein